MTRTVLSRIGEALISLFLMSIAVFLLARLTGDPEAVLLGEGATEADKQALIAELGLNRSTFEQYFIFLGNVLQGDFGRSIMGDQSPAFQLVLERLPYSLLLASASLVMALGIGIPLGVAAAVNRGQPLDVAARIAALFGQSVPPFWLGLVLIYVFAVQLGWARTSGFGGLANIALPAIGFAGASSGASRAASTNSPNTATAARTMADPKKLLIASPRAPAGRARRRAGPRQGSSRCRAS